MRDFENSAKVAKPNNCLSGVMNSTSQLRNELELIEEKIAKIHDIIIGASLRAPEANKVTSSGGALDMLQEQVNTGFDRVKGINEMLNNIIDRLQ